jgi:alkylation response protein AidB-like acyl-CoA dehydrogenase
MSDALQQFREETREWLEQNCPASMRTPTVEAEQAWGGRNPEWVNPEAKDWMERMGERGWTAPMWPKEYGGGGLSKAENKILQQELGRIKARTALASFGIWMLGPALLEFASEEQKKRFLPPIVRGEIRWCQGYSEPNAGSDLAGLQTRAEDKGDHYLVNGSKIWTSYADKADWIFALVRTDTNSKHDGISFLLIDMATAGVETRPITLISGASPFCETYFTDVKVPKENLVGVLNKGWTIAKRLLHHEREMLSSMGSGTGLGGGGGDGVKQAKRYLGEVDGRIADSLVRDRIVQQKIDARGLALTVQRAWDEARSGGSGAGDLASMLKYYGTELNKKRYEMLIEIMGHQALGWEGAGYEERELATTRQWLRSKGNSIEGGTTEVQLNVIAKRILGLPDK